MNKSHGPAEETRIAQEITSVLPAGSVARVCSDDRDSIRFSITGEIKLRLIILSRDSLRRLLRDPARAVKIEYLQRDLLRTALRRSEFRYPRLSHIIRRSPRSKRMRLAGLAVAALGR